MSGKARFLLGVILVFSTVLIYWKFGQIPPLSLATNFSDRISSSFFAILLIIATFILGKILFRNIKYALLWSLILVIQPWFIQEARIFSPVLQVTLIVAISSILYEIKIKNIFIKYILIITSLFFIPLFYPKIFQAIININLFFNKNFIHNIFYTLSFNFLFFQNDSFWWGGVREIGILLPFFIPFFIIGLFEIPRLIKLHKYLAVWFIFFLIINAQNPVFPEGRYFFPVMPILTLFIAVGIKQLLPFFNKIKVKILLVLLLLLFIYDYIDFLHTYTVHYKLRVNTDISKINEKF